MTDELALANASETLARLRSSELSASALLEAIWARIQRDNPRLNAIVTLDIAGARRRAQEADEALAHGKPFGPLHGLPITIKDNIAVAGLRATAGSRRYAAHIAPQDAPVVARLRRAGAILLGKTNLPEFALDWQSDNPVFGRTNNPWDPTRTPGGSTGGGAAAVAAGLSFLETGNDMGGSLRLPAHFCGIYALAPSEDRVPKGGGIPPLPTGTTVARLCRTGCLARSVPDLRLWLQTVAGPCENEADITCLPLGEPMPRSLRDLRIAWSPTLADVPIDPEVADVLEAFVQRLHAAGCQVGLATPPIDLPTAWRVWARLFGSILANAFPAWLRLAMPLLSGLPLVRSAPGGAEFLRAADLNVSHYIAAERDRYALIAALDHFLADWDAWLLPVAPIAAFPHTPRALPGPLPLYTASLFLSNGERINYYQATMSFTTPINVTGHPAVVLPVGRTHSGLPVGAQIIGRRGADMALLDVAEALSSLLKGEQADELDKPYLDRPAPIC